MADLHDDVATKPRTPDDLRRSDFVQTVAAGVSVARQDRSQQTHDRIVAAAIELCDGVDFAEISVAAVCESAGVSPSSFYSRFRDGEALLTVVHERYLETMFLAIRDGMTAVDWPTLTLPDLIVTFCELFVATGRRHHGLFRSMQRTELGRPRLIDRRITLERAGLDVMTAFIAERTPTMTTAERERVRVAWASLNATLRDVLGPYGDPSVTDLSEPQLFAELAAQFCAYTALPHDPPRPG